MKKILSTVVALLFATAFINGQEAIATSTSGGAAISFEKTVHDYGTLDKGADGNCEFVFTNIGTEPLVLSSVTASCGCTVPSWSREPVLPGQSSVIKVHYDTNRIGGINKTITVLSNDARGNERASLRIAGTIQMTAAQQVPAAE